MFSKARRHEQDQALTVRLWTMTTSLTFQPDKITERHLQSLLTQRTTTTRRPTSNCTSPYVYSSATPTYTRWRYPESTAKSYRKVIAKENEFTTDFERDRHLRALSSQFSKDNLAFQTKLMSTVTTILSDQQAQELELPDAPNTPLKLSAGMNLNTIFKPVSISTIKRLTDSEQRSRRYGSYLKELMRTDLHCLLWMYI